MTRSKPIYLDNHATTPCDPRVVDEMLPYFTTRFGNAASTSHSYGLEARAGAELARARVAALIGASPKEIIWTSGATESDNLAVLGVAEANQRRGRHIVTTNIEHEAVLDAASHLQRRGWEVTILPVGPDGRITVEQADAALRDDTVLLSVMAANNEIGTLQPIGELGALCRARGVVFHTDAVQALGRVPLDVQAMNIDLLSISAHKMYGPKGVGALFVRRGRPRLRVQAQTHGGGQERGIRSGTLAVPLVIGLGKAAELARHDVEAGGIDEVRRLRDRLWRGLEAQITGMHVNGSATHRLPNNLNVSFDQVDAQALMMSLRDIAFSSGSACATTSMSSSHVLRALELSAERASSSVRFGIGRFNTEEEIDHTIGRLIEKVTAIRSVHHLGQV